MKINQNLRLNMEIFIGRGLFILTLLITFKLSNGEISLDFPIDLGGITGLIQKFLGPYLKDIDVGVDFSRRSMNEKSVNELIEDKIIELRPLLQDNDKEVGEKLDEETTIIEFLPRQNDLREDNETQHIFDQSKYKKIRQKINNILDKQAVPIKSKNYILQVFDDLIKQALKSQCQWKSIPRVSPARFRVLDGKKAYTTAELEDSWKKQWEILKEKYLNELKFKDAPVTVKDIILVFENFNTFFSHTIKDINDITTKYEISCQIVDRHNRTVRHYVRGSDYKKSERSGDTFANEENKVCKRFKMCSIELKEFLLDLYKSLNETTVAALKTYAEMYARDANTDGSAEGLNVTSIINDTARSFDQKVKKAFIKELANFTLDENKDKHKNIALINGFLKRVTDKLKTKIKNKLGKVLDSLRDRLKEAVELDVTSNLNVEFGNLERETADKLCTIFKTCNSNSPTRRSMGSHSIKNMIGREGPDPNAIYVKLGVDLSPMDGGFLSSNNHVHIRRNDISKDEYDSTAYNRYRRYSPTSTKSISYPPVTRTTLDYSTSKIPVVEVGYSPAKEYIKHREEVDTLVHKNRSVLIMDYKDEYDKDNEIKDD